MSNKYFTLYAGAFLCLSMLIASGSAQLGPLWAQRGHDAQHSRLVSATTRTALYAGPSSTSFSASPKNLQVRSLPVVDSLGVAYSVAADLNLTAIDLSAEKVLWSVPVTPQYRTLVLSSTPGAIYLAQETSVSAYDTTKGNLTWKTGPFSPVVSDLVGGDQFLVVVDVNGTITALSTSGGILWKKTVNGTSDAVTSLLVASSAPGYVFALHHSQVLQALDPAGNLVWSYSFPQAAPSLDLITDSALFASYRPSSKSSDRNTAIFSLSSSTPVATLPSMKILARTTDKCFIALGTNLNHTKSKFSIAKLNFTANIAEGNVNYTVLWLWNDDFDGLNNLWDATTAVVDGNDMIYVGMLPQTTFGIAAKTGKGSWRYDSGSNAGTTESSLGVANATTVLFVPKGKSYQFITACSKKGTPTVNLTCACMENWYGDSCQYFCLANKTCSGNGECESDGNCSCTETDFWEFTSYGGDSCDEIVNLTLIAGIFVALAFVAVIVFTAFTIWKERTRSNREYAPLGSVID